MPVTTKTAVPIVEEALKLEGIEPTPRRVWAVLTTARAESGYGTGWHSPPHGPESITSKNWGAVQARGVGKFKYLDLPKDQRPSGPAPPSDNPSVYFNALDYNPFYKRSDGGMGSWFHGPYRVYPSDVEGARDVARLLEKKGALDAAENEGTTTAVAQASYGYYTGMTGDKEKQIGIRAKQLWKNAEAIAKILGTEPVLTLDPLPTEGPSPVTSPLQPNQPDRVSSDQSSPVGLPTLRLDTSGDAIKLWQRLLNNDANRSIILDVDGQFGPITHSTTRHWQSRRKLVVDGIVGPISWSRMP